MYITCTCHHSLLLNHIEPLKIVQTVWTSRCVVSEVVTLGSRQSLCINQALRHRAKGGHLNDLCRGGLPDERKKRKSEGNAEKGKLDLTCKVLDSKRRDFFEALQLRSGVASIASSRSRQRPSDWEYGKTPWLSMDVQVHGKIATIHAAKSLIGL